MTSTDDVVRSCDRSKASFARRSSIRSLQGIASRECRALLCVVISTSSSRSVEREAGRSVSECGHQALLQDVLGWIRRHSKRVEARRCGRKLCRRSRRVDPASPLRLKVRKAADGEKRRPGRELQQFRSIFRTHACDDVPEPFHLIMVTCEVINVLAPLLGVNIVCTDDLATELLGRQEFECGLLFDQVQ